jgi:hypothetical protein
MKRDNFKIKIDFGNQKIVDHEFNTFEEVETTFKDLKRKFKGGD